LKGEIDGKSKSSDDKKMIIPVKKDGKVHKINVTIVSD
jgi:hypothetical protein